MGTSESSVSYDIFKNIWLFCVANKISITAAHITLSLSCHEQVCLIRLRFERYFSPVNWGAYSCYVSSPFSLIGQTLQNIRIDQLGVILAIPKWSTQI